MHNVTLVASRWSLYASLAMACHKGRGLAKKKQNKYHTEKILSCSNLAKCKRTYSYP